MPGKSVVKSDKKHKKMPDSDVEELPEEEVAPVKVKKSSKSRENGEAPMEEVVEKKKKSSKHKRDSDSDAAEVIQLLMYMYSYLMHACQSLTIIRRKKLRKSQRGSLSPRIRKKTRRLLWMMPRRLLLFLLAMECNFQTFAFLPKPWHVLSRKVSRRCSPFNQVYFVTSNN
jgi:hypothetical protein